MNPKLIQALLKILRESPRFMEQLAPKSAVARARPLTTRGASVKVPLGPMAEAERALSGFPPGSTTHKPGINPQDMLMEYPRPSMESGARPEVETTLPELLKKIYGGLETWHSPPIR